MSSKTWLSEIAYSQKIFIIMWYSLKTPLSLSRHTRTYTHKLRQYNLHFKKSNLKVNLFGKIPRNLNNELQKNTGNGMEEEVSKDQKTDALTNKSGRDIHQ